MGIYYNRWFTEPAYREQISTRLNLKFTDAGFGRLAKYGGGSSFDGQRIEGKVEDMPVLSRRDHLSEENKALLDEILDEEMKELAAKVEEFTRI